MSTSRIAVIGGGIAGLASGWILQSRHQVRLFEATPELGGHAHTMRYPTRRAPRTSIPASWCTTSATTRC